jgi:hypothetical protein
MTKTEILDYAGRELMLIELGPQHYARALRLTAREIRAGEVA